MVSDYFVHMLKGMENLKELRVSGNSAFKGYMLTALKTGAVGREDGILLPNLEVPCDLQTAFAHSEGLP